MPRLERWRPGLALLGLLVPALAAAGEAALRVDGAAPYPLLRVPPAVQAMARDPALRDLQVLNARGEALPHAWVPAALPEPALRRQRLPVFDTPRPAPVPDGASAPEAAAPPTWVLDARRATGHPVAIELQAAPGTRGVFAFALERSDDLQRWTPVVERAQWVALEREGQRLTHTRFALDGVRSAYLRVRALPGSALLPGLQAELHSVAQAEAAPALDWSEPIAPTRCTPAHCDYPLPRHAQLRQLDWRLAQPNTLAAVRVLLPQDATPPTHPHRHGLRVHLGAPLRELRHKTAPPASAPPPAEPVWTTWHQGSLYWLALPEGEARSPAIEVNWTGADTLRLAPTGGMAALGATPPQLRVASAAQRLVFLAREPAPFRLRWGGDDATSAMPLAQLMPLRRAGDPLPVESARVDLLPPAASAPAPAPAASQVAAAPTPTPSHRGWLWAALLAALGAMGFMAARLLRAPAPPG